MKLNEVLSLPTCSTLFPFAGDPGAIIPVVCGDFLSSDVNSSDLASGGMCHAVLIDVRDWTYALHYGRTPAGFLPLIYVEDVLQQPSVYAFDPIAYYGVGSTGVNNWVTTIRFNDDPGGRRISWRGYGAWDAVTGGLLTNPIKAIQYVFTTFGHWTADDFDPAATAEAIRRCDAHGYPIHWEFAEHRTYKEWLTDLAPHYFLDMPLTYQSRLALALDEVVSVDPGRIVAQLDAPTDLAGENPEDSVEWDLDRRNLCNNVTVRYQLAFSGRQSGDSFTAQQTLIHAPSISLYGATQPREILLPGIRTQIHLDAWAALFFARYALLPAMVRFPVKTTRYLAAQPSQYVTLTWRAGPSRNGTGWHDRILKVLNFDLDDDPPQIPLECFDTGLDFEVATFAILLDSAASTWYLSSSLYGDVQLASFNPGVETVNGTPWSWIRLISPDSTTRYVQPTTGGGWSITSGQPAGVGTTNPVMLISRDSAHWRLAMTNSPFTVIFIRETRLLPFGMQTALTEAIGRFRLDFNVLA